MEGDINVPKTKSVNIFLQFTKLYTYILVSIYIGKQIIEDQKELCSSTGVGLVQLNVTGSIVMIIMNVVSLIFIWLKEPFARLEFFFIYAINLSWSAVALTNTYMDILSEEYECPGVIMFQKAQIFLLVKVHLEVILTFFVSLPFPFRITFLPTTLLPVYIIFTAIHDQMTCGEAMLNIEFGLIFVNFIVICLGVPLAFFLLCTKTSRANNAYKFLIVMSALGQMGVITLAGVAWMNNLIPLTPQCVPSVFAIKTYLIICPIAVGTSLFMLLSLKSNNADNIRDDLLKEREKQINQIEYVDAIQRNKEIQVQQMTNTVKFTKEKTQRDNVSVSYGTISRKG